jgi:hypothetical protein
MGLIQMVLGAGIAAIIFTLAARSGPVIEVPEVAAHFSDACQRQQGTLVEIGGTLVCGHGSQRMIHLARRPHRLEN